MYEASVGPVPSRIYFCLLVIVGSIFLLNLALAIVTDAYEETLDDSSVDYPGHNTLAQRRRLPLFVLKSKGPSDQVQAHATALCATLTARWQAVAEAVSPDVKVGQVVLHERLGVGLVRRWDKEREKWEVGFFEHRRLRTAANTAAKADTDFKEIHSFSMASAHKTLLHVPRHAFRIAVMEVFQSDIYQALVTFCVLGNAVALASYHFNMDTFISNYIQAMFSSCRSVLPSLADAAFSASQNYTQLWAWRRAVLTSTNISAECASFFATDPSDIPAMPPLWEGALEATNQAFSIFFLFDLMLGLVGAVSTQPRAQLRASGDAVVSVLTAFGMWIPFCYSFAVLRLFTCLFRLVRLFRMRQLERVLYGLGDAMSAIVPLLLLLGVFVLFFAILGVQFFGPYETLPPNVPAPNWISMGPNEWGYGAIITVIQILSGENWNEIMHKTMTDTSPAAALYFILLILFGSCASSGPAKSAMQLESRFSICRYLLVNVFTAALSNGLSEADADLADCDDDEEAACMSTPEFCAPGECSCAPRTKANA